MTPVIVHSQAAPGTLPRLRYGRSYAFRAWAVDLAGNSRPHQVGSPASPSSNLVARVVESVRRLARAPATPRVTEMLRAESAAVVMNRRGVKAPEVEELALGGHEPLLGSAAVDTDVLSRLRIRRSLPNYNGFLSVILA